MADVKDVIITDDLQIKAGDVLVSESDAQHVDHILRADKGHFRQHPLLGVGINNYRGASVGREELKRNISLQLRSDNINVRKIDIDREYNITIDAKRLK